MNSKHYLFQKWNFQIKQGCSTSRGGTLVLFKKTIFGDRPWNFSKGALGGSARQKNAIFFVKIFQKVLKNDYFVPVFFKTCPPAKLGLFTALEDLEKSIWSTQEKVVKIFENFLKIRPPRENSRSAPVGEVLMILPAF